MLNLKLIRLKFCEDRTLGVLITPENIFCSLELAWKVNARNISCVPEGRYQCVRHWSRKFPYDHLMLMDVPDRLGILVHAGNGPESTSGCILIARGFTSDLGLTATSKAAVETLMDEIRRADGNVFLEVKNVQRE